MRNEAIKPTVSDGPRAIVFRVRTSGGGAKLYVHRSGDIRPSASVEHWLDTCPKCVLLSHMVRSSQRCPLNLWLKRVVCEGEMVRSSPLRPLNLCLMCVDEVRRMVLSGPQCPLNIWPIRVCYICHRVPSGPRCPLHLWRECCLYVHQLVLESFMYVTMVLSNPRGPLNLGWHSVPNVC